ncbi:hypothetical protein [Maribacter arenosus]|uniref:Cytochrome c domain-containing protein n=1 Tax=Maribacter arenosus TaxID=1854708 RepID=A0ABR7VCM5_9FLAO|nr:hypothetical protein [Maribacter arenosus]MBD0851118.1 hypothetical protein [Maribacter arenosus]
MKRLFKIVLVSSLSLFCFSCYYDELPEEQDLVVEIPDEVVVSFQDDVQPIFAQCISCHNGNVANPDLREGNSYNAIAESIIAGDADNSEFYKKLPGIDHPQDVGFILTSEELGIIKAWIDRGGENN